MMVDEEDYQLMCSAAYSIVMMLSLELSDSLLLDSHCFAHVDWNILRSVAVMNFERLAQKTYYNGEISQQKQICVSEKFSG